MWEKRTVWELGTRVPLILHVPWLPHSHGARAAAPVELVDIFPTLLDLTNLPHPKDDFALEGTIAYHRIRGCYAVLCMLCCAMLCYAVL